MGRRPVAVLAAIAGLVVLYIAQGVPNRHAIEDDLTGRSTRALADHGLSTVEVSFVGRDGTVVVRSAADRDRARTVVEAQEGVRVVAVRVLPSPSPLPATPPSPAPSAPPSPVPPPPQEVQNRLTALPRVTFETGSAVLTGQGQAAVSGAAAILAANPAVRVRIEGHTDTTGTAPANLALSQARAETVRAALVALGIAAARLEAVGFGETRPAVPDTTPANQAVNRRVAFVVLP